MDEKTTTLSLEVTSVRSVREVDWIFNEDLLRDEGAYYGLSGTAPDEKIDSIRKFYAELLAHFQATSEDVQAAIDQSLNKITHLEELHEQKQTRLDQLITFNNGSHKFFRLLFSIIAYSLTVAFAYWLIYDRMQNVTDYPVLITLGLYILGTFSLFHQRSILFFKNEEVMEEQGQREKWKIYLEEFGLPLVVTLYVIIAPFDPTQWWIEITVGLLIYLLLLYSGKGLLVNIQRISSEFRKYRFIRKQDGNEKSKIAKIEEDIKELEEDIKKEKATRKQNEGKLEDLHSKITHLEAQGEAKVALFISEYEFAKEYRHRFPEAEVERLLKLRKPL